MKRLVPVVFVAALTSIGLSACETSYVPYAYGHADGYYDNFYGPFAMGYWGADGVFQYRRFKDFAYLADQGQHFRRDFASGYRPFHTWSVRPIDEAMASPPPQP